jgi:hypothetical protein
MGIVIAIGMTALLWRLLASIFTQEIPFLHKVIAFIVFSIPIWGGAVLVPCFVAVFLAITNSVETSVANFVVRNQRK